MRKLGLFLAVAGALASRGAFGVIEYYDFNMGQNLQAHYDNLDGMFFRYFDGMAWVTKSVKHFTFKDGNLVAQIQHPTTKGNLESFWILITIVEESSSSRGQARLQYWNGSAWLEWPGTGKFPFDHRVAGAHPILN